MAKKENKTNKTPESSPIGDLNEIRLRGTLSIAPEHRIFGSGASLARLLVTVRQSVPRNRTDVIPITLWEPDGAILKGERGTRVEVEGQIQRRFWTDAEGRRSRIEVIADRVRFIDA
ncbi:MAG: single-stranded DNA-binding protein [Acidimicrobiia bacterium]|nr:single-stranded DNA-binding protein [bacterium]MXX64828.1 single-stranded DNA-binding protein [Acidimicrobiia bacterium]MCY3579682.1 single-stranded DNA-binding protein [bacterium]MCY3652895.1 single-stranded DNA-binding protein [bacterium]MDE0644340.1 single-stranded DNA-binding protein [bacterium]